MRRFGLTLVAAAVAISSVVLLPAGALGAAEGEDGTSGATVTRYGGTDRYATSRSSPRRSPRTQGTRWSA